MPEQIKVKMCCHSSSQAGRFQANVGDTVLLRENPGYTEAKITAILSPTEVEVAIPSKPDAPKSISTDDIVSLMLAD